MNGLEFHRRMAKLTQAKVADALGVSVGAVSLWETGKCSPDTKRLKAIANLYGCSVDDLLQSPET